jgi:glucose/mannose transport system substrate-binding protein
VDLLDKVLFDGCTDHYARIVPITQLEGRDPWTTLVRGSIAESLTYFGKPYAVPLNIHRLNLVFYSPQPLNDRLGTSPDQVFGSLDNLVALAAKHGCQGGDQLFALSTENMDAIPGFLFENLLPAIAYQLNQPDYPRRFWDGCAEPGTDDVIGQLVEYAIQLWPCFDTHTYASWSLALEAISGGMMVVMGDWAKAYLVGHHKTLGTDFQYAPFPGTNDLFVYTTDTFPLTRGTRYPDETLSFLASTFSAESQIAFNRKKGSIPARAGISFDDFRELNDPNYDEQARISYELFDTGDSLLASSGQVPAAALVELGDRMNVALGAKNAQALRALLVNFYPRVKKWAWLTERIYRPASPCSGQKEAIEAEARQFCPVEGGT